MWAVRARPVARSSRLPALAWAQRRPLPGGKPVRRHSGELEPPPCTGWRAGQGVAEDERGWWAVLGVGAVLGAGLGAVNLGLQEYAQKHPHSRLAQRIDDDCRRMYNYVVPISATVAGLGLWMAAVFTGPASGAAVMGWTGWWLGAQRQWAVTGLLGLSAGHYAQEIIANKWCGPVLLAHHIVAIGIALGMHATSCWRGLLLSWGALYEAGSLLLCLGYVGVVPRLAGHWAATVSSLAGMGLGVHTMMRQSVQQLNTAAWFNVTTFFALGLGRIQEGAENLIKLTKRE